MEFILGTQGWLNIPKLINAIQHINKTKGENRIILSIDAEKAFDKIHLFIIRTPNNMGIEKKYLNIMKAMYNKPSANIVSGEKMKAFPLRPGTRQGCPLTSLIQHTPGSSSQSNQARERNKIYPNWE